MNNSIPLISNTVIFTSPLVVAVLLYLTYYFSKQIRRTYRRQIYPRQLKRTLQMFKFAKDMSISLILMEGLAVFITGVLMIQHLAKDLH